MTHRSICLGRGVCLAVAFLGFLQAGAVMAWGPHQTITRAALDVLPERERWEGVLGAKNLGALTNYCLLPDLRGKDLGPFYADDYLLIRELPMHVGHTMPTVEMAFGPYFRRALQALRTETPENACRQLGPLVHFVEDVGAPPHAKEKCPHHKELENWVRGDQIGISGYRPRVLGSDDDAALAGLLRRVKGLVEFSVARADRALPLVSVPEPEQAKVEPILLESANESARVTADVLLTVLTLGLDGRGGGAGLGGTVTAAEFPGRNEHGARVVLLDTDYATLATTSKGAGWRGQYEFRDLPPGSYRVLAYRTASQFQIQGPITLGQGRRVELNFDLKPTEPAGNIIENPDGCLSYLDPVAPDRWKQAGGVWTSTAAWVKPGERYRCGAALKDPGARVSFRFEARPAKDGKSPEPQICPLTLDGAGKGEVIVQAGDQRISVAVVVESTQSLTEVIDRVWVVPATGGSPVGL